MPTVCVVIKALNEAENIGRAVETSLKAIAPFGGDVVVADSGSTDRTVEIASAYPVTVVQLENPGERCCGISPQLGFQYCSADYVYVLDGDMALDAGFIASAVARLEAEPKLAGVGGFVQEMRISNLEFESRLKRQLRRQVTNGAEVDCLNGGGLYRCAAIADVGYLSDRNLHSFEEFDLGARLRGKGWTMIRLSDHAADHYGYAASTLKLMLYRLRSKYVFGCGELVRAALASRYLPSAVRSVPGLRPAFAVWVYWLAVAAIAAFAVPGVFLRLLLVLAALAVPVVVMAARNGMSLAVGLHSVALWHLNAWGLLMGFIRPRVDPGRRIDSRLIRSGEAPSLAHAHAP